MSEQTTKEAAAAAAPKTTKEAAAAPKGAGSDLVEYEVPEGAHVFCRKDKVHKGPGEIAMMPRSWVESRAEQQESGPSPLEGVPTLDYGRQRKAKAESKRPKVRRE